MLGIKLKSSKRLRRGILHSILMGIVLVNVICFYGIHQRAEKIISENTPQEEYDVEEALVESMNVASHVLFLEAARASGNTESMASLYQVEEISESGTTIEELLGNWGEQVEILRTKLDYYIAYQGDVMVPITNNDRELGRLASSQLSATEEETLQSIYSFYTVLSFDERGNLSIQNTYEQQGQADLFIKSMYSIYRQNLLSTSLGESRYVVSGKGPRNCIIVFAIAKTSDYQVVTSVPYSYVYSQREAYRESGSGVLFYTSLVLIAMLAVIMNSSKIWKEAFQPEEHKKSRWLAVRHPLEIAAAGYVVTYMVGSTFYYIIRISSYPGLVANLTGEEALSWHYVTYGIVTLLLVASSYYLWYLSLAMTLPIFRMGIMDYIKEYSMLFQIFPWIKKQWNKVVYSARHLDLTKKQKKMIWQVGIWNVLIIILFIVFWPLGIVVFPVYCTFITVVFVRYLDSISKDYIHLRDVLEKMGQGQLEDELQKDLGIYDALKEELEQLQKGYQTAVNEERKSQRLKTELITNVSHDLKTPLTAMTTYIELLKEETISEDTRKQYLSTIESKAKRLRTLIDDLFEVSKASSETIQLNPVRVDLINLMKQVYLEHEEQFLRNELEVRWTYPEEKVIAMLDSQKTYRIVENLYLNVVKYAQEKTRVYIQIDQEEFGCRVQIKNTSAYPLNFDAKEITERFVRGDLSRNTEGSGLGLAIVQSFVEAQGGKFRIVIDGDLFKAELWFSVAEFVE